MLEKPLLKYKRKISAFLLTILAAQTILSSFSLGAIGAPRKNEINKINLKSQGVVLPNEMEDMFNRIDARVGTAVKGEEFDQLSFGFDFSLDNDKVEKQLEVYMNALEFELWPEDQEKGDAYLTELYENDKIKVPGFTCVINDKIIDVNKLEAWINNGDNGSIITNGANPEKIGTATIEKTEAGPKFVIQLLPIIYNRVDVWASLGYDLDLLNKYEEGTTVKGERGDGGTNVKITIDGNGVPLATDSNYKITKELDKDETEPGTFVYHLKAEAIETTEITKATNSNTSVATSSTFETESEAEEHLEIELINDLFSSPKEREGVTSNAPKERLRLHSDSNLDLTGKIIADTLPKGLELKGVEISWNKGSYNEMTNWEDYYSEGQFLYSVEGDGDPVLQCDIRLITTLSEELWREYYSKAPSSKSFFKTFSNQGLLLGEDEDTILNYTEPVDTTIEWSDMMEKEGGQIQANHQIPWTISFDGHFSSGVQLYVVDHIGDINNTHNYIWDTNETGKIKIDGNLETVERISLTSEDVTAIGLENLSYNAKMGTPSINTIKQLFEKKGLTYNDGLHYAYEYGGNETVRDAVLLLSIKNYVNKPITITYETEITAEKDSITGEYKNHIANDVRAVWKWEQGEGPGEGLGEAPWGSAGVSKGTPVQVDLAKKTAGDYKEDSKEISWDFQINQTRIAMNWFQLEDTLPDGLVWNIPNGDMEITTGTTPRTLGKQDWDAPWEAGSLEDVYAISEDKKSIKIHLNGVAKEDYYKFTLGSTISNEIFAQPGPFTFKNTAKVTAKIGEGTPTVKELSAEKKISHNLIQKEVFPYSTDQGVNYPYDYVNNQVQWKVMINPKKLPITYGDVVDILPVGTSKATLVSAKKGEAEGTIASDGKTVTFDAVTVSLEETTTTESNMVTFQFKNNNDTEPVTSSDTYEFVFKTDVEEEHRREVFKSGGENYNTTLKNHVTLEGSIESIPIKDAKDDATNTFPPQPLLKTGVYKSLPVGGTNLDYITYEGDGTKTTKRVAAAYAEWTVYINRTKANFEGVKISDTVAPVFELLPTSMVISLVELDEQGKETTESPLYKNPNPDKLETMDGKKSLTNFTLKDQGFSFTIPNEYAYETLKLTFQTVVVEDAAASELINKINAWGNDMVDATDSIKASGASDFSFEDYANANGMISLAVRKKSDTNTGGAPIYLKGAKFKLQEMKLKENATEVKALESWEENNDTNTKEKTSNEKGKMAFLFLKPDTLYHLTEIEAPEGYIKEKKTWYVVILKKKTVDDFPQAVIGGELGTESYDLIAGKEGNQISTVIANVPDLPEDGSNGFSIRKTGQQGQLLSGVAFTLTFQGHEWKATTDENGIASFSNLDPSGDDYYELKETVPSGYLPGAEHRVHVDAKRETDGTHTYTLTVKKLVEGTEVDVTEINDAYPIINVPYKQSGSFTKINQNGETLINPKVTFLLSRQGDGGTADGNGNWIINISPSGTEYFPYQPLKQVTSEEGIVTLKDLYSGYYKLEETSGNEDIETLAAPIYLQVKKDGIYAKGSDGNYTINLNKASNLKVVNKIKGGRIQVNKVAGDPVGDSGHVVTKPLKGIQFVISQKGETEAFLTLETNDKGQFVQNTDGSYTDTITGMPRSLVLGDYTIREVAAPSGFLGYLDPISFSVTHNNWNRLQTIGYDGKTPSVVTAVPGEEPSFYNVPMRGKVELTKQDEASNTPLDGAVFVVYTDEAMTIPVGFLAQKNNGAPYVIVGGQHLERLKQEFPNVILKEELDGISSSSGNDTSGYGLLYGVYYLKELRAPYGYEISRESYRLKVGDLVSKITIGNQKGFAGFSIKKTVEVLSTDLRPSLEKKVGQDFWFEITGTEPNSTNKKALQFLDTVLIDGVHLASASNGEAISQGIRVKTGVDGIVEIAGLPVGSYEVKEVSGPDYDQYTTQPIQQVMITQSKLQDQLEVSLSVVNVHNEWRRGDLRAKKNNQNGAPLAGAVFELCSEDGTVHYQTTTSDVTGSIYFDSLPLGTYVLREVKAPNGYLLPKENERRVVLDAYGTEAQNIVIVNKKISSGGDGGGGTNTSPRVPNPSNPNIVPSNPGMITPTVEETTLDGVLGDLTESGPLEEKKTTVEVPGNPPNIIIYNPRGAIVYQGNGTELDTSTWEAGEYTLLSFDDMEVPLGRYRFSVTEEGYVIGLAKTGDTSPSMIPWILIMLGAMGGLILVSWKKRRQ